MVEIVEVRVEFARREYPTNAVRIGYEPVDDSAWKRGQHERTIVCDLASDAELSICMCTASARSSHVGDALLPTPNRQLNGSGADSEASPRSVWGEHSWGN